MNKKEIALKIRQSLEKDIENEDSIFYDFGEDLRGLCAICSFALTKVFQMYNEEAEVYKGQFEGRDDHCWVETKQRVWDITASQFHGIHQPVLVVGKYTKRYAELYKYGFVVETFNPFKTWYEEQKPTKKKINYLISLAGFGD